MTVANGTTGGKMYAHMLGLHRIQVTFCTSHNEYKCVMHTYLLYLKPLVFANNPLVIHIIVNEVKRNIAGQNPSPVFRLVQPDSAGDDDS